MADLYWYRATAVQVTDGDTLKVMIDLGLGTFRKEIIRLAGINTPERGKPLWAEAKAFLGVHVIGRELLIRTFKDRAEKYGRYLALVYAGDPQVDAMVSVNFHLLNSLLAVPYYPGREVPPMPVTNYDFENWVHGDYEHPL